MEASQKYLQKFVNEYITDLQDNPASFPHVKKITRYGKYRELEGALEVGLSDVRIACREVLSKMAKEDNI